MRQKYLDTIIKFEPFSKLYEEGYSTQDIKNGVIELLNPYIIDKIFLNEYAVSLLANEAICISQLCTKKKWKSMFETIFTLRNNSILKNKDKAFKVMGIFEPLIREAQQKYSLQIIFENSKEDFNLDEYAFELFRLIGTLIESVIQPFIKEYYCLVLIFYNKEFETNKILNMDLGQIITNLEELILDTTITRQGSFNIKISQWRNISQHYSYKVENHTIIATYGKSKIPNTVSLTKDELFKLSKEFIHLLGSLKSSREFSIINNKDEIISYLPTNSNNDSYGKITELASSFFTQGFKLLNFNDSNNEITALFIDLSKEMELSRKIHCSQFILPLANRFPNRAINVIWSSKLTKKQIKFSVNVRDINKIIVSDNPLIELANTIIWPENFQ